jgi:hypothetical protein
MAAITDSFTILAACAALLASDVEEARSGRVLARRS